MQLFLQQFQACNIHIEKQNYLRMFRKVACPFWSFQQPWLWWRFSHRTFTISKLPLFGNQSNMRITFELSWARGTRHAEIALLPVPLPVLIISITEHAPHPPSSHICLTSVWPFCRRYESKVSFKLTFERKICQFPLTWSFYEQSCIYEKTSKTPFSSSHEI